QEDFVGDIIISAYGMDMATAAVTTGDDGMYAYAGGIDSYYGEWEIMDSMFDEDTLEAPTQGALDNAAEYNLYGKLPTPLIVRIPENSRINPGGSLRMEHLVPGVRFNLGAEIAGKQVRQ